MSLVDESVVLIAMVIPMEICAVIPSSVNP